MCNKTETNIYDVQNRLSLNKLSSEYYELTEKDFYPPEDTRLYKSLVEDIDGGDNFNDYAKWFYKHYEKEIFDI